MPKAYVRVWVEGGSEEAVKARVLEVDEAVQRVDLTTGEQDLMVLLEAPWFDHILEVVNQRIRRLPGVRATATSFVTDKTAEDGAGRGRQPPRGREPAAPRPVPGPIRDITPVPLVAGGANATTLREVTEPQSDSSGFASSEPVPIAVPAGRTQAAIRRLRTLRGDHVEPPPVR